MKILAITIYIAYVCNTYNMCVSGFWRFGLVYFWLCDRALTLVFLIVFVWACGSSSLRLFALLYVLSVLWTHVLSVHFLTIRSCIFIASCVVVFGEAHGLWVFIGCVLFVMCEHTDHVFSLAECLVMFCVSTWLFFVCCYVPCAPMSLV